MNGINLDPEQPGSLVMLHKCGSERLVVSIQYRFNNDSLTILEVILLRHIALLRCAPSYAWF